MKVLLEKKEGNLFKNSNYQTRIPFINFNLI